MSATAYVATQETTASTTYTDLTTTTDQVTVTIPTSGCALVILEASVGNYDINTYAFLSYDISGATTRAASDDRSFKMTTYSSGRDWGSVHVVETGLNPGSTTFKMKYRQGSSTGYWHTRRIAVIPLDWTPSCTYVGDANESTTSTSYVDLTTTTDQVTANIGSSGNALVVMSTYVGNDAAGAWSYISYALSGANTRAAADSRRLSHNAGNYGQSHLSAIFPETGLTPGLTTFKMKYKVGSNSGNFKYRRIAVIPL